MTGQDGTGDDESTHPIPADGDTGRTLPQQPADDPTAADQEGTTGRQPPAGMPAEPDQRLTRNLTPPPAPRRTRRMLGGRYELGELLGRGGMADVRRGYDTRLNRTVAIKTLRSDLASDSSLHHRFRREAQNAARLNHPSIVAVYDTGEDRSGGEPIPYIVMEFVPGRTLREVLREGRAILPERALEITADVLRALAYSHTEGIVHRDIKPGNVMLTPSGDVKVMDFGIARAVADTHSTMTATAAVMGTAQYLSPEQARGEQVDARSDLYSTGCLLYELLTGRPPFIGDSPLSVALQHVREHPDPPSARKRDLDASIDVIVMRSLAKDPGERYQTADDFRADVERAMAGQNVTAVAVPPPSIDPSAQQAAAATESIPGFADDGDSPFLPENGEEPQRHRGRRAAITTLLVVAILGLFVAGAWALQHYFNNQAGVSTQAVPAVEGLTQKQAEAKLDTAGLMYTVDHANSPTVDKGVVISQDPPGDTMVDPNTAQVTIVVSDGKDQVTIPIVIGKDVNEADQLLTGLGFTVKRERDESADGALNTVVRVDPGEGETVDKGSAVTLYYALGMVSVPDVVGLQQSEAEAKIKALGLSPEVVTQESEEDPGTVVSQEPGKDDRVRSGSTVVIIVAVPMPSPSPTPTPTPTPTPSPETTPPA